MGIVFSLNTNLECIITCIKPGYLVERFGGLHIGDQIVSINGVNVTNKLLSYRKINESAATMIVTDISNLLKSLKGKINIVSSKIKPSQNFVYSNFIIFIKLLKIILVMKILVNFIDL